MLDLPSQLALFKRKKLISLCKKYHVKAFGSNLELVKVLTSAMSDSHVISTQTVDDNSINTHCDEGKF